MPPRSCSIWRMTWRKLPFCSPTRLVAGHADVVEARPRRSGGCRSCRRWGGPRCPATRMSTTSSDSPACGGAVGVGAGDQVAPVGVGGAAGPDLLPLTIQSSPSRTARVRSEATSVPASGSLMPMHHADVPATISGSQRSLLVRGAELQQRRADLAVGEPRRRQRRALGDQRLEHDEALDGACGRRRRPRPARSCRASPARPARGRSSGEVADDPRVLGDRLVGRAAGLGLQSQGRGTTHLRGPRPPARAAAGRARSPRVSPPVRSRGGRRGWPARIHSCSDSNG